MHAQVFCHACQTFWLEGARQGLKRVAMGCIQPELSGWKFGRFDSLVVALVRLR